MRLLDDATNSLAALKVKRGRKGKVRAATLEVAADADSIIMLSFPEDNSRPEATEKR
jgi:hypothetical protein